MASMDKIALLELIRKPPFAPFPQKERANPGF